MTPEIIHLPAFAVIGYSARTHNKLEMTGDGRIGPLWRTYLERGSEAIPAVADQSLTFSVYTNYGSDHTGEYDVVIGKPVNDARVAPPGLRGLSIPAADYVVFPAEGKSPDAIRAAWMTVYEYFEPGKALRRAFTFDFERYSSNNAELYIAIR